jgi:hypothetical protein
VCHGHGAQPQVNTFDARQLPLPVFGPLPIEGLPPVSPWFRDWRLGPLVVGTFASLTFNAAEVASWLPRRIEGWNVVNQHEAWKHGDFCQLGYTETVLENACTLVIEAGADGPLKVWFDGRLVIDDATAVRDLATVRTSAPLQLPPGRFPLVVGMNNRGGQSWGFCLRLRFQPSEAL